MLSDIAWKIILQIAPFLLLVGYFVGRTFSGIFKVSWSEFLTFAFLKKTICSLKLWMTLLLCGVLFFWAHYVLCDLLATII